ncbi:MAG: peptidylprolyl isomerase [Candidatus Kuenenbacteria bacterium]
MKKLIVFTVILAIALSGCSLKKSDQQEKSPEDKGTVAADLNGATNNADNQDQTETINQQQQPVANILPVVTLQDIVGIALKTNFGDITVGFYSDAAPNTVTNFVNLAAMGYYNDMKFHRVIKDFMIQSGDPNSKDDDWSNDGMGGPGYTFPDEINANKLVKGSLAMANSGPNTNGSQFFIVTASSTPWLDDLHTNFGYVAQGMDTVEKIENVATNENDHPTEDVIIQGLQILLTEEGKKKVDEANKAQQEAAAGQQQNPQDQVPQTDEGTVEN